MHQLYPEVMLKRTQNIISFLLLLLIFVWTLNSVNINSLTLKTTSAELFAAN